MCKKQIRITSPIADRTQFVRALRLIGGDLDLKSAASLAIYLDNRCNIDGDYDHYSCIATFFLGIPIDADCQHNF